MGTNEKRMHQSINKDHIDGKDQIFKENVNSSNMKR